MDDLDRTYNILRKSSFDVVHAQVSRYINLCYNGTEDAAREADEICETHGWTLSELTDELIKQINDKK